MSYHLSYGAEVNPNDTICDPMPICPECGAECEWYYRNQIGEIIGCENCIDSLDAYAYEEERRNGN